MATTTDYRNLQAAMQDAKCSSPVRVSKYSVQVYDEISGAWLVCPKVSQFRINVAPLLAAGGYAPYL